MLTRLLARVEGLGARVEWVRIAGPHAGAYDLASRTIYLDWDLDSRPRHAVSTLAHELAHHVHQDAVFGDVWVERRADVWAARWLICPGQYRRAERIFDGDPHLIAQDLGVTARLVRAFQVCTVVRVRVDGCAIGLRVAYQYAYNGVNKETARG